MRSAINREGTLQAGGRAVAVSGPIDGWGVGEQKADFWVRIVQGKEVAQGASKNSKFERKDDRWDVVAKVSTEGVLVPGPAYAEYWARVDGANGSVNEYWPIWPIRLK